MIIIPEPELTTAEKAERDAVAGVDQFIDAPLFAAILELIADAAAGNISPNDDVRELARQRGREVARAARGLSRRP